MALCVCVSVCLLVSLLPVCLFVRCLVYSFASCVFARLLVYIFVPSSVCLSICVFSVYFVRVLNPLGFFWGPLGPIAFSCFDENNNFQHILCLPVVKCHTRPTIMLKKPGHRKGKQQPPKAPETTKIDPPGKKIQKKWAQVGPETHESEPTNRRGEANLRPRGHRETQNKHTTTPKGKQKGNKQPKCTKPANSGSPRGVPKFRFYTTFR